MIVDNSNIDKGIFSITGAVNGNTSTDRDMKLGDVFYNQTPDILPFDCTLISVTAATSGVETWEAHVYQNGTSIYSLNITADTKAVSPTLIKYYSRY
jgi:hypothetical protein